MALLLGGLEAAAQDYEAQFVNGIKAMDRGSWKEAIAYFRAAIAARSREGGTGADLVQIYGMRTRPYLPHYYLGVAYASSSNCEAALEQFAESVQQGAIQKSGEYKNLLRLQEKCRGSAVRVTTPGPVEIAPPPTPVVVAQALPTAVATPSARMPVPSPTGSGLAAQALKDAQRPVVPPQLPRDISIRINEARQLLAEANRNPSLPPESAGAKARLQALLDGTRTLSSATPLEQRDFDGRLKTAMLRLNNSMKSTPLPRGVTALPQVAARVPPPLLEGASAYFSGDYARAVRTLDSVPDFNDRHADAEARLIRSAARYALFVIGGRKDGEMEQQARRDVSDCRRLDPRVSPNRKAFSPRFVQFFAQVLEGPSSSAN